MNTFFLFFLPLTWALAKETKSTTAFEMNKAVNLTTFISGLAANDDGIIATIPKKTPPFQDILSGVEYNAETVTQDSSEILFASKDKAYSLRRFTGKLIEHNLKGSLFRPTVVEYSSAITNFALGNDKRVFVSSLAGSHNTGIKSIISTYKDGAFIKLRELNGNLFALTLSHDNTKLYGILHTRKEGFPNELIEISLHDKKKDPKVIAQAYKTSREKYEVKSDKQGNIYVLWKKDVIEVFSSQGKSYNITSGVTPHYMAISNSEPQFLYVGGIKRIRSHIKPAIERIQI